MAGGYTSCPNYVSVLRGKHIDDNYVWDRYYSTLRHMLLVQSNAALDLRGNRAASTFPGFVIFLVPRPTCRTWTVHPFHSSNLAVFYSAEVEATTARVSSWKPSLEDHELTGHLPLRV